MVRMEADREGVDQRRVVEIDMVREPVEFVLRTDDELGVGARHALRARRVEIGAEIVLARTAPVAVAAAQHSLDHYPIARATRVTSRPTSTSSPASSCPMT